MKLPEFRTGVFAIWKACRKVGIRPPDLPDSWNEATALQQALVLAFNQVTDYDELKTDAALAGAELK